VLLKNRKGAEASGNAFLRNQPARLDDSPFTICGRLSIDKWKLIQRDASAIDAQFFRRTAQLDQPFNQRLGTREHERHCVEKAAQFRWVILDLGFVRDGGSRGSYLTRVGHMLGCRM